MRFDTAEALANHVKKFCQGSSYEDVDKLEQRLQYLGTGKPLLQPPNNLSFEDIRAYLSGNGQALPRETLTALQAMNLEDLRNYFQSEQSTFDELSKHSLRAKERQLQQEIATFKRDKADLRMARLDQDRALQNLGRELDLKREREVRARLEKQEIERALAEIEQGKATAIEREKRRELERLADEREALRAREEEVIEEIRALEREAEEKERRLKEDRERIQQRFNGYQDEGYKGGPREREIQFAKERGEQIARLQSKRDGLNRDRQRIMDDLEKVKAGDMQGLRRNEASRWAANDIISRSPNTIAAVNINQVKLDPAIKDKLVSDSLRIEQLKQQRQQTLQDYIPEYEDNLDPLSKKAYPQQQPRQEQQIFSQFNNSQQPAGPVSYPSPSKMPTALQSKNGILKSQKVTFEDEAQDDAMIDKLRKLRDDYAQMGNQDPEFFAYLNDLENHILRKEPISKPKLQNAIPPHQPLQHSRVQSFVQQPQQQLDQIPQAFNQPFVPPLNLPQMPPMMMPPIMPGGYIAPPPPPATLGGQSNPDIERLLQSLKPEPAPISAQQYLVAPKPKNEDIEKMNTLLSSHQEHNDLLERELENLKAGRITFDAFEKLMNDPILQDVERTKRRVYGISGSSKNGASAKKGMLPDDFRFRQNDLRAEDMEIEERALMNIAAQEFDELRILARLPKGSEVYKHKMEQYKEMSAMRAEMEKVLQEQKLEKIRREYEVSKMEDQRKYKHDRWLEEQQKALLEVKLNLAANPLPEEPLYQEPYYDPSQFYPQQQQSPYVSPREEPPVQEPFKEQSPKNEMPPPRIKSVKSFRDQGTAVTPFSNNQKIRYPEEQKQLSQMGAKSVRSENDPDKYLPFKGFNMYFDFIARIARQYRSMRLVYAVYNVTRPLIPPSLIDIHDAEPDPEDPNEKNRIIFREFASVKNIQPHPSSTLIIEIQCPKPNMGTQQKFISYGWTLLNLFDYNYNFNRGIYRLPLYQSPTRTDIDIRDIQQLERIPDTVLMFRLGNPGDQNCNFQYTPQTIPEDYTIPRIHQFQVNQTDIPMDGIPDAGQETVNLNPQYNCRGARLYVHFMKYYVPKTNSRVQLTLYDGGNIVKLDEGQKMCNWASKPFDSSNIMFEMPTNPMNINQGITPTMITKAEVISVEDEVTWLKDLYKMQFNDKDIKNTQDITLVVQVMESKGLRGANETKSDYQLYAYGVLRVNNYDGTIRYGAHEVPLFKPPINLIKRNPSDLVKQTIKITIAQPTASAGKKEPAVDPHQQQLSQPQLPQPQVQNLPTPNIPQDGSRMQQQQPNQPNQQQQQPYEQGDLPFIQNEAPQHLNQPFKDGDGIDIYIDGARYLPENTTFSRVVMRGFTVDSIRVLDPVKGLCDLNMSTARMPFYGFRYELRAPKLDPTVIIEATVETIDRSDGLEKIIGYCYFPLFLTSQNSQNLDRKATTVVLQNGMYQLPIYLDKLPPNKNISLDNIQKLEKIPCATLLLRVYKAPVDGTKVLGLRDVDIREWKNVGVIVDPADYSEGKYCTKYCNNVSPHEMDVYNIKSRRDDPNMRQVCRYLMKMRGRNETLGDEDMVRWLDRILVTNQSTPKINMRYFSAYVQRLGFRFSVERLHGITQKLPHIVATSMAPPGSLYQSQPRLTPDVTIFSNYSMETHWSSLQYLDDIKNFTGLPMASKLGFVIDVKALQYISATKTEPMDVGWAFLPIFSILPNEDGTQSIYTNSGLHALPLFPGPVPNDIINYINQNQDNIISMLKPERNEKILPTTSVIVRIHDNQREWMAPRGFYGDISYSYIAPTKLPKLAYAPDPKIDKPSLIDSAKSATPPSMQTRDGFMAAANVALQLAFGA